MELAARPMLFYKAAMPSKLVSLPCLLISAIAPEIADANTSGVHLTQGLTGSPPPTIRYQDEFIIFSNSSCQTKASSIRKWLSLP